MFLVENSTQDGRSQYSEDATQVDRLTLHELDTENAGQIRSNLYAPELAEIIYEAIFEAL